MDILDCNLIYGRPAIPVGRPYLTPKDLLSEMDRLGVDECWCSDWRALENHPRIGNRQLCEDIAGHDRLHAVWTVLPPGTDEMPAPDEMLAEMKDQAVSMVRSEPGRHSYSVSEWCCGSLWQALEARRVPLLLEHGRWEEIDAMLGTHPDLPVILTGVGYRANRTLFPLLDRHPKLRLEISTYLTNDGLREVSGRFGAGRLLYGSGSPFVCPEEALGTLEHSGLTEDEKAAVAAGNLRELLAEVQL